MEEKLHGVEQPWMEPLADILRGIFRTWKWTIRAIALISAIHQFSVVYGRTNDIIRNNLALCFIIPTFWIINNIFPVSLC